MSNVAIIQARMGSTRFPGKVLEEVYDDMTVIEFLIERLKFSRKIDHICVATSISSKDDILCTRLKRYPNLKIFRGSEDNVLGRVCNAAKQYGHDANIIEITADCPLVDPNMIDSMLLFKEAKKAGYISNCIVRQLPDGFDIQIYTAKHIIDLNYLDDDLRPKYLLKEHVGWNLVRRSGIHNFNMINYPIAKFAFYPDWRLTVDYKEDLSVIRKIVSHFSNLYFTAYDVIEYIKENIHLLDENKNCITKIPGVEYE